VLQRVRELGAAEPARALGTAALALVSAALVLEVWNAMLDVPWVYSGDGNQYGMFVKGILDHGWHLTNPNLGAPHGQQLYDFPIASGENIQALMVKLLGLAVSDWATAMNLYFLLTFPLAALTSYAVLRRLGSGAGPAVVCSTLFALLPYHFARGERELFISGYFAVPLGAYLVLSIFADEPLLARRAGTGHRLLAYASRRSLLTVGLCLTTVLASGSFYYAAFTILLVGSAAVLMLLVRRSRRAFVSGAIVVALLGAGVLANLAPTLAYRFEHGPNELVRTRGVNESEIFALKLTQLLLPIEDHRVGALAERSARYAESTPFGHLGRPVHLGFVASVGFVWLLVVAIAGAASAGAGWRPGAPYRHAAVAGVLAFLIGTVGGVSALIAATVTPQFRAWNRISIFIAFFALLAVALALTELGRRWRHGGRRLAFAGVLTATLVVGVLDQTSSAHVPPYETIQREYASDARFVHAIEARLSQGADVLQLPYVPFPEAGRSGPMGDYDLVRPYFHSRDLRWSFGSEKGRPQDWLAPLATKRVDDVLSAAVAAGFEGLYIDRLGYSDRGGAIEADVSRALDGAQPLVSANRRLAFFDLRGYR
jgi:phosphoglycerol transferase